MLNFVALLAGAIFGAGLTISQMVDPRRVQGFLDVAAIPSGTWDPTLLFVFAGALPVMFLAYRLQRRIVKPVFAAAFQVPARRDIDARLLGGSALFGVGWGLAGICPGPAITGLALAGPGLAGLGVFILAMLAGVVARHLLRTVWTDRAEAGAVNVRGTSP
jgi:hypothetical protein